MPDPDLDRRLRGYLDFEERERAQKTQRESALIAVVERISNQQTLTDRKLDLFAVEVKEQLKGVQSRVSKLEDDAEDTGVTNLESLRVKVKEERDSKSRLFGYIIAGMGAIGLLSLGGAGTVIWYLITSRH